MDRELVDPPLPSECLLYRLQQPHDMIGDNGKIEVTCEFCSTFREFEPGEFDEGSDNLVEPAKVAQCAG
jgi:hypothetical protein